MKFGCECGATIYDSIDDHPQKGHLIPDQEWNATYDAMDDEVIAPLAARKVGLDAAYHLSREIISRGSRMIYQCSACGRLYVEDKDGSFQCYLPADESTPKQILRSRGPATEA